MRHALCREIFEGVGAFGSKVSRAKCCDDAVRAVTRSIIFYKRQPLETTGMTEATSCVELLRKGFINTQNSIDLWPRRGVGCFRGGGT